MLDFKVIPDNVPIIKFQQGPLDVPRILLRIEFSLNLLNRLKKNH